MRPLPRFEELLPSDGISAHEPLRAKLISVLNSTGEILPSANSPRGKLWRLVNSPNASIDQCAEVIQLDSALAARLLRVANSGAYGFEAENIPQAVSQLGLRFVREQVFNSGVFKQYSEWNMPPEWDTFWLRNIFVASLCERLCAAYGRTNGSEYLAGLLHDIGWLFLATYAPDEYAAIFASGKPVAEAEDELLPFGHAAIAAAIAERSLLPARSVAAIRNHHPAAVEGLEAMLKPEVSADFLAAVLSICDDMADTREMNMFCGTPPTLEQIMDSPAVSWLTYFGKAPKLGDLADEVLLQSRAIFEVYFRDKAFK